MKPKEKQLIQKINALVVLVASAASLLIPAAQADDIEALFSAPRKSNILLILDVSGSMGWSTDGQTRISQMKNAINTIIDNQSGDSQIGFSYFGGEVGSGIKWPISRIDSDAHDLDPDIPAGTSVGQVIKYMSQALTPSGNTPSADALFEAALYFRGEEPHRGNGQNESFGSWNTASNPPQYTGGTSIGAGVRPDWDPTRPDGQHSANPITIDNGDPKKYLSPINECQANAIIFLSDGAPTRNNVKPQIKTLLEDNYGVDSYSCETFSNFPSQGQCAPDLVKFLAENDQISDVPGSKVRTYTIGFHLGGTSSAANFMRILAEKGDGKAFSASDTNSLVTAINAILQDVAKGQRTFTGVSTSVDRNSLKSSNRVFMPVFEPNQNIAWEGNVKGYFLQDSVLVDLTGEVATTVQNGGNTFKETATSFWSDSADGNETLLGGLRNRLDPDSRKIYVLTDPDENSNITLGDGHHNLKTSNTDLSSSHEDTAKALLGLPDSASYSDVRKLIEWMRSARMGDPLHSRPSVIDYGGSIGNVLFIGTNQGYLHAFDVNKPTQENDTTGGDELFAFMPYEHLSKQFQAYRNDVSDDHIYGNDGDLRFWVRDINGDGNITGEDKVYLFFGMRRGGDAYYGLDVTDPDDPKVMWRIKAGDSGFEKLGQTWSAPALVKVKNGNSDPRTVLVFGGGYDTAQDLRAQSRKNSDSVGMGVYIVDPITGQLLNSIGGNNKFNIRVNGMNHAVPSDIRVIDIDADGKADRMYFGDMGGDLWRIDIDGTEDITSSHALSGYKLAALSSNTSNSNRRFFYPPAVAWTFHDQEKKLAVAIGSGYRAHPLEKVVNERMHVIFDAHADDIPDTAPDALVPDDLENVTSNLIQEGDSVSTRTAALEALNAAQGWFIDFSTGEKSLSQPIIFENKLLFTTFSPGSSELCSLSNTTNRYYAINLNDGTALETLHNPETDNHNRSVILQDNIHTIAPEPQIVFYDKQIDPDDPDAGSMGCASFLTGLGKADERCADPKRVYWRETEKE